MRKKELVKIVEELEEKVNQLEQYAGTQDALIYAFKKRENRIIEVLKASEDYAAKRESETQKLCTKMITDAEDKAGKTIAEAEESAERILKEAKEKVEEYRRTVKEYNDTLMSAAKSAREKADTFASFARNQMLEPEELDAETDYFANSAPEDEIAENAENPATLMHNIYKIQKRELPENMAYPEEIEEEVHEDVPKNLKRFVTGSSSELDIPKKEYPDTVNDPEEAVLKTVSELLDKEALDENSEEPNLDSLLDEIINFGETKEDGERKE